MDGRRMGGSPGTPAHSPGGCWPPAVLRAALSQSVLRSRESVLLLSRPVPSRPPVLAAVRLAAGCGSSNAARLHSASPLLLLGAGVLQPDYVTWISRDSGETGKT